MPHHCRAAAGGAGRGCEPPTQGPAALPARPPALLGHARHAPHTALPIPQGAVTITVRYCAARQQFGPPDGAEIAVLDYPTQQLKLMPMLATAYALHFAKAHLISK